MTVIYTLSTGRKLKVSATNKRESRKWGNLHYAYTIALVTDDGKRYTVPFHDSAMNFMNNIPLSEKAINTAVYCILEDYDGYDYNRTLSDFMDEFGYDPEDGNGEKAFNACKKTYDALHDMLTLEELNSLTEQVNR